MSRRTRKARWSPVIVAAWVFWGLAFAILEYLGLRKAGDAYPPLTYVFRRYVPQVAGIGACAWLAYHAAITYASPESE